VSKQDYAEGIERTLILAPRGRDALLAQAILHEANLQADICKSFHEFLAGLKAGCELAIVTEESFRGNDTRALCDWVSQQPAWSDFPFIVLTEHGGGVERNPLAAQLTGALGSVSFLERPFHPTTLISVVRTHLRGRRRQYECRRLNEELEFRVQARTKELAAANRQLLAQMEERERVESTLRQMQRLEAVGQLTSGVAHDFNNLLTVVLGNIAFMEKDFAARGIDGKLSQRLRLMRTAAERGAKLTDQLLSFSRRQRLEPKVLDLNATIARMRDLLQSTMGGSIRIETLLADGLWHALVDPTQLELAVLNLAINARDAMGVGGLLRVSTQNARVGEPAAPEEPAAGDYVEICVSDTGSGMTPSVRARVFEPFFTTKEIGKGSGLGLSQVLGFAKQSNGGVRIDTAENNGTSIRIFLPRSQLAHETDRNPGQEQAVGPDLQARILLVDDDDAVRQVTADMLSELHYEVVEVGSAGAAFDVLDSQKIDLLLLDFAMPGMSGAEVARRVRARLPKLPIVFVTGHADLALLEGVSKSHTVGKPFDIRELAEIVADALTGGPERMVPEKQANSRTAV
jgi:signal transduction histidine kinase/ActR/RegA family two-component response regulator